ncbi:hypothetical protein BDK51DRAFT_23925, partial [Blyttiomyces helicus]
WFRTGDLGQLDAESFLFLVGRIKEQINRGGEKISPLEIDAALLRHPQVTEAVAFPVKSAVYGEEIEAAVVVKGDVDGEEVRRFLGGLLAPFKVPRKVHVVEAIPKTATGKVQRRFVAEKFEGPKAKL